MKGGSPPTALKARTGLFTPPGITAFARAKSACDFDRCMTPRYSIRPGEVSFLPMERAKRAQCGGGASEASVGAEPPAQRERQRARAHGGSGAEPPPK